MITRLRECKSARGAVEFQKMAKYSTAYNTGALFDPDAGAGSVFAGSSNIPRSIASDGRRWVLFLHVIVHIAAICVNVVNTIFIFRDFAQTQIQTVATIATAMHGVGVLALLALAASEIKQVAFTVSVSFILSFLMSALMATAVLATFTFRSAFDVSNTHFVPFDATVLLLTVMFVPRVTDPTTFSPTHTGLATRRPTSRPSDWDSSWLTP